MSGKVCAVYNSAVLIPWVMKVNVNDEARNIDEASIARNDSEGREKEVQKVVNASTNRDCF